MTADAGNTYAATAVAIRAAGGHYLLVIKANQPKLLAHAGAMLAGHERDFPDAAGVTFTPRKSSTWSPHCPPSRPTR